MNVEGRATTAPFPAPVPPPLLKRDHASVALRGSVAPSFGYNVAGQVLQFGLGVVLARLLSPEDFGLLGMALVFAQIGGAVAAFGLPKALIQAATVSETQYGTMYTVSLALSVLVAGLLVVAAPLIAGFYGNEIVGQLVMLLALNFVLNGLGTVPYAILNRRLMLGLLARIDPLATMCGGLVSVGLAWAGSGAWALAGGVLAASALRLVLYHAYTGWIPRPALQLSSVRGMLGYGVGAGGMQFFHQLTSNVDFLLIGRLLNPFDLGIYMRALRLVRIPQLQFSAVVVRLLFPYFARIQDDVERIRRNFLRVVAVTGLLAFPALLLLGIVARDFVEVVYGAKWLPAVVPLRLLCVAGMLTALSAFAGPVLDARGCVRPQAALQGAYAVLLSLSVLLAARWGINGVAAALALCSLVLAVVLVALLIRTVQLSVRDLCRALLPGLLAALGACAGSGVVYLAAPGAWPAALRMTLAVLVGTAASFGLLEGTGLRRRNPWYADVRDQITATLRHRLRREVGTPPAAPAS